MKNNNQNLTQPIFPQKFSGFSLSYNAGLGQIFLNSGTNFPGKFLSQNGIFPLSAILYYQMCLYFLNIFQPLARLGNIYLYLIFKLVFISFILVKSIYSVLSTALGKKNIVPDCSCLELFYYRQMWACGLKINLLDRTFKKYWHI